MLVTWTALQLTEPASACPWTPAGATFSQSGQAGPGRVEVPSFSGEWWSVLATWDDEAAAHAGPDPALGHAWHVVLSPVSFHGDAVLGGGATPFATVPARGKVEGAAAVVTLAGLGPDPARVQEFLERVVVLGGDVEQAEGRCASLIQAPADGAVMTFSAWRSLRDAVTWAYHRPTHAATVARQAEHELVAQSGFLRCAVVASSGTLHGTDPLAGLTGTALAALEPA